MQVVIHRPTVSGARLWIQAELKERHWSLEVREGERVVHRWSPDDHDPDHLMTNTVPRSTDTRIWFVDLDALAPATEHTVWYLPRPGRRSQEAGDRLVASFRTLPTSLRDGPFRVLLASCYCEDRDEPGSPLLDRARPPRWARPMLALGRRVRRGIVALRGLLRTGPPSDEPTGRVARRYQDVRRLGLRPDVKFLVGDQVYLDAPYRDFLLPMGQSRMKRHISRTYSRTWDKLNHLLAHGGTFFITDDHEFWNNYPANPLAWITLLRRRTRERWELHARDFLHKVQDSQRTLAFDIGSDHRDLAFFLADTRVRRERPRRPWSRVERFMAEDDFARLVAWLRDLDSPGVLVLGQPLLAPSRSFLQRLLDRGLPDHADQYRALCEALADAGHDVLILTGDIHYARYARVTLTDRTHVLHELVASPLTLLPAAGNHYGAGPEPTSPFPVDGEPLGMATYSDPLCGSGDPCRDHFMILEFARDEAGAVTVDVSVHLVRPEDGATPTPPGPLVLR
jgi:hypothetical protein